MSNGNATIVVHQLRFLKERVDLMQVYFKAIARTNSLPVGAPIFKIDEPIKLFDKAIQECVARLDKISVADFLTSPKAHLGFFQKRMRRARIAQDQLAKLSVLITADSSVRRIDFVVEPRAGGTFGRYMEERARLSHVQLQSMNDLVTLQVPAVLACQSCAYAALVVAVSNELLQLQAAVIAEREAAV